MTQKSAVGSRHLGKTLDSLNKQTCVTLNSIALILDFFTQKIENVPNLPGRLESELTQTVCYILYKTVTGRAIL